MWRTSIGTPRSSKGTISGKHSTVVQAEVFAVGKAADHLLGNKCKERKILINCDSKSAIQSIESTVIRNGTSLTTTTTLNSLGNNNEVTLRWIPAHSGYEGNEIADQLAKAASSNDKNSATTLENKAKYEKLNSFREKHVDLAKTKFRKAYFDRHHQDSRKQWQMIKGAGGVRGRFSLFCCF